MTEKPEYRKTTASPSSTAHEHSYDGQTLRHSHPGGNTPHGYFGHPEDAGLPHEHSETGPLGCSRCDLARSFPLEAAQEIEAKLAAEQITVDDWGHRQLNGRLLVDCDEKCLALDYPRDEAELRLAYKHWRGHSYLAGCSHSR